MLRLHTQSTLVIPQRRLGQVDSISSSDGEAKYGGFLSAIHSALICLNFTENGWGLTRDPQVSGIVSADIWGAFALCLVLLCKIITVSMWIIFSTSVSFAFRHPLRSQTLVDDLRWILHRGLDGYTPEETITQSIEGQNPPKFINQDDLNQQDTRELKHIHEAWAGVKLSGNNAYDGRNHPHFPPL